MKPKLMLVDGNSIFHRAFHGLQTPSLLSTSDGLYTNAIYGFINILNKYMEEENPGFICVAFDMKAPTFRHKQYTEYKADRKGMPEELAIQLPVLKQVLSAMNIRQVEYEGYEADDIIGSLARWSGDNTLDTVIVTGDRDLLQLAAKNTRVKIPTRKKGRNVTEEYDYQKVVEKYGVTPHQIIDVKGLMGDKSDNIPGVRGVGEKTALALIREYGSVEKIYENLDNIGSKSINKKLNTDRDSAFLSKKLAAIYTDLNFELKLEDFRYKFNRVKLKNLFERLEFKSLIDKFELNNIGMEDIKEDCVEYIDDMNGIKRLKKTIKKAKVFSLFYLMNRTGVYNHQLIGIGIALNNEEIFFVDILNCINESDFLDEFKVIFQNAGIKKYCHSIKDLLVYFKKKDINFEGLVFDTLVAAYVINPGRDTYTVKELALEHLELNIESTEQLTGKGKDHTPLNKIETEKLSSFCGTQANTVLKLVEKLDEIIERNSQKQLYYNIELPLVKVLAEMEYQGFKVDPKGLEEFSNELKKKIDILIRDIYEVAGEKFNINSPKQLGVILFEKIGLPVIKKTKTGYSTSAKVLEQLEDKHVIISKIFKYRQLVKLESTYVKGLLKVIDKTTGRIHSSFNQSITATGRISSTAPNLQNIPVKLEMGRRIRKVFVPASKEYLLVDADYSQIELRVLAHISNDENMIRAFRSNEDIHAATASKVFNVPDKDITPVMRSRAKAINFGIVYGMGDFSLSRDLKITRKEARRYIDEYLNKYPGVRQYMDETVKQGEKAGYVSTLFGRRRYLPELRSGNFNIKSFGKRVAMNTPIQGSAADIIKIAMVRVYNALKERNLKSHLILQVHDELIIETHKEEKDLVMQILKTNMENAVSLKVPLSVDIKCGHSWYETK